MITEIKTHVKDFDGFLNEQKLNEELKFDKDNYFCQMIKKYTKKNKTFWYPGSEKTDEMFGEMIQEILQHPKITAEEIRIESGYKTIIHNEDLPEIDLIIFRNAKIGWGFGQCWLEYSE